MISLIEDSTPNKVVKKQSNLEIDRSLNFYQNRFTIGCPISQEEIVDLGSEYETLYKNMKQVIVSKQNQIYLMFGLAGNGKKTAIKYCLNLLNQEQLPTTEIIIDARIYNSERLFLHRFYKEIQEKELNRKLDQNDAFSIKGQGFLFSDIDNIMKVMILHSSSTK